MSEVATITPETNIEQSYKIINLKANNFLRLKAIDITPGNDPLIRISGPNGAGKSSVLKAIYSAFANREISKEIKTPIRTGEESGSVSVDLGDLIVTRVFTPNETYLKVENKEGLIYKSPQAVLDKIKTSLTFDPLAFTRLSPADQRAALIKLLGIDIDALDRERESRYTTRTDINRQLKEAEGKLSAYQMIPAETPDTPVSSVELIQEIRSAEENNKTIDQRKAEIETLKMAITRLENDLAVAKSNLETGENELAEMEVINTAALEDKLASVEQVNRDIERKRQANIIMADIRTLSKKSENLTDEIEQIDTRKKNMLTAAAFPVENLSFDSSGVSYRGVPLAQASSAEKIRISCAIGMAMKPGLRVMLIEDGSLLDSTSRDIIKQMAEVYGMQIWIEMVDESGSCGIIIEDGEVKNSGQVE